MTKLKKVAIAWITRRAPAQIKNTRITRVFAKIVHTPALNAQQMNVPNVCTKVTGFIRVVAIALLINNIGKVSNA